ncbi:MAG: hypothetical protein JSR98_00685 [Proteobacteria bacterium]|nr:hypothetical protein [Pseudomonadota bacterium]
MLILATACAAIAGFIVGVIATIAAIAASADNRGDVRAPDRKRHDAYAKIYAAFRDDYDTRREAYSDFYQGGNA